MGMVGNSQKLQCTFYAADGITATNPAAFTMTVFYQDSIEQMSQVIQVAKAGMQTSGTGVYYYYFTPTVAGRYWVQFQTDEADGTPETALKQYFDVDAKVEVV